MVKSTFGFQKQVSDCTFDDGFFSPTTFFCLSNHMCMFACVGSRLGVAIVCVHVGGSVVDITEKKGVFMRNCAVIMIVKQITWKGWNVIV